MELHVDIHLKCSVCGVAVELENCHVLVSRFDRYNSEVQKLYCEWPCIRKDAERQSTNLEDLRNRVGIFDPAFVTAAYAGGE